jgi:hypothetical protein
MDILSLGWSSLMVMFSFSLAYFKIMAKEIFTTAGVMWALTLTGLTVGFGLLKIQGE